MNKNYSIVRLKREPAQLKRKPGRKPFFPRKIPYQEQVKRLGKVFDFAAVSIAKAQQGINVSIDPRAVIPERALVFETIGPVAEFNVAAQALGFEWLATESGEDERAEEIAEEASEAAAQVSSRPLLYLTMPSALALNKLLALWRQFSEGVAAPTAHRALWSLFGYLKDVRVWSVQDRIDPAIASYVEALLAGNPNRPVKIEIDLWYRTEPKRRDKAVETLIAMLVEVQGEMLDFVSIPEISYQAALVQVPASVAQSLASHDGKLAYLDEVMTIRPQSSFSSHPSTASAMVELTTLPTENNFSRRCIAALLDGYPVTEHIALKDQLIVHEVDVTGTAAPLNGRYHGTAMASLVLHGDLHAPGSPIDRKLAVIPVLVTDPISLCESTPSGKLPIGVIYRSLKAIVEADQTNNPHLSDIALINHSICDGFAPFVRRPSPWAALLDYFSHHHRLLFVISAGNIFEAFPIPSYANLAALQAASPQEQLAAFLVGLEKAKAGRGLLSPAESINGLTVGALHADGAGTVAAVGGVDPYAALPAGVTMTNLASAVGYGVNRSLKPDLVEHGGRFVAGCSNLSGGGVSAYAASASMLGHKVATPSPGATGSLGRTGAVAGTSNSAALVTRIAIQAANAIEDSYAADNIDWMSLSTRVPILKALITHGCGWGDIGRLLDLAYPPVGPKKWHGRRATISKFLGYGRPRPDRVISGSENRVTLLGEDTILSGGLHEYRIPLPSAMLNTRELRTIVVTLAWTSPITTTTADYRGVSLSLVDESGKQSYWKGVRRTLQPNAGATTKGTLTHLILEGKSLQKDALAHGLFVGVQALARHPSLNQTSIPYALVVTLEMAQSQNTKIYEEVEFLIVARARARNQVRVGERT